jgi:hypothetical protein
MSRETIKVVGMSFRQLPTDSISVALYLPSNDEFSWGTIRRVRGGYLWDIEGLVGNARPQSFRAAMKTLGLDNDSIKCVRDVLVKGELTPGGHWEISL